MNLPEDLTIHATMLLASFQDKLVAAMEREALNILLTEKLDMKAEKKPIIIGLTGAAGSGKDTVANVIAREFPGNVERYALASPLKDGCAHLFGVPRSDFDDRKKKDAIVERLGWTPRELAQYMGTEVVREQFSARHWLDLCALHLEKISAVARPPRFFVVTDVRFDNEADWVRRNGGVVVKVVRPDLEEISGSNHVSEKGVNPAFINHRLVNDGGLDRLTTKAWEMLYALGALRLAE